jgi:FkbM family methyltransferase
MEVDLSEYIQRHIYLGCYEPRETRWVRDWLRPGMTVIDAGANVGYFTALAASCVGTGGRVFAVEPSPYAFERLQRFLDSNHLMQACAFQAGLGDFDGMRTLYWGPENARNHAPSMVQGTGEFSTEVPVWTLDRCLSDWRIDRVDLLKIDVEGFEHRILRGGLRALKGQRIKAILIEFNDWCLKKDGSSCQELYNFLVESGFADNRAKVAFRPDDVENRFLTLTEQGSSCD